MLEGPGQGQRRLRYRHVFLAIGAVTTALILGVFWVVTRLNRPHDRVVASIPRPSPPPLTLAEEPPACRDLYRVVCHGIGLSERDPTGLVRPDVEGERIVASIYKSIVADHPDWKPDQIDEELAKMVYTPVRRGRIEAAYHWVQSRIIEFIESQPDQVFTAREKKLLVDRVQGTVLEIPPPASLYSDEPDLLTTNDVFYERTSDGQRRMRVGGAYLFTAKSWFNMVFTMGHELGHSIDPCEVKSAGLSFPAYDRLKACFIRSGIVATPKNRVECGDNDQLSEAFADWLGAHVTSDALNTFSLEYQGPQLVYATANAVRDLCAQASDGDDLDVVDHPPPKVRIERIFGGNPGIRSVLGCTAYDRLPAQVPFSPLPDYSDYCQFAPGRAGPKTTPKAPL